jgi:hypothetical protein
LKLTFAGITHKRQYRFFCALKEGPDLFARSALSVATAPKASALSANSHKTKMSDGDFER